MSMDISVFNSVMKNRVIPHLESQGFSVKEYTGVVEVRGGAKPFMMSAMGNITPRVAIYSIEGELLGIQDLDTPHLYYRVLDIVGIKPGDYPGHSNGSKEPSARDMLRDFATIPLIAMLAWLVLWLVMTHFGAV